MSATAQGGSPDEVIIDLEEYVTGNKQHPEHDPGIIVKYRLKIDEEKKVVDHRRIKGDDILNLVGKSSDKFCLFQLKHEHGHVHEAEIKPHEGVDLGTWGIERFITKKIVYHFFIGKVEYTTHHSKLTVRQILVDFAKVDPTQKTLAQKKEGGFHEYKNLDKEISLKDCPHFVLFDNQPTNVS